MCWSPVHWVLCLRFLKRPSVMRGISIRRAYVSLPHLPDLLQHVVQSVQLLGGVGRSGVLRNEDELLHSWNENKENAERGAHPGVKCCLTWGSWVSQHLTCLWGFEAHDEGLSGERVFVSWTVIWVLILVRDGGRAASAHTRRNSVFLCEASLKDNSMVCELTCRWTHTAPGTSLSGPASRWTQTCTCVWGQTCSKAMQREDGLKLRSTGCSHATRSTLCRPLCKPLMVQDSLRTLNALLCLLKGNPCFIYLCVSVWDNPGQ